MSDNEDAPLRLTNASGAVPTVLLVGGISVQATIAIILLDQFGCLPRHAPSGEAALAVLRGPGAIDLVMIDERLPDMDGLAAAERVRAVCDDLPIVVMADYTPGKADRRSDGLCTLVRRPYSPRELFTAMDRAMGTAAPAAVAAYA